MQKLYSAAVFIILAYSGRGVSMPVCAWALAKPTTSYSFSEFSKLAKPDTYGMLSKADWLLDDIRRLPIRPSLKSQLLNMGGYSHLGSHLTRLFRIGEDSVEGAFALSVISDPGRIPRDESTASRIILEEGQDTALWWTFAPYIYHVLKLRGIDDTSIIQKLICWAGTANPDSDRITLEGLQNYTSSFVLDPDPDHLTHRFAFQEANRLAADTVCFWF